MTIQDALKPGQTIGPNKEKRQKGANSISREQFVSRFQNFTDKDRNKMKKSKVVYFITFIAHLFMVYLLCPICKVFKEATTDNFAANNAGKKRGGIAAWFKRFPHSFNLGAHGCNDCFAKKSKVRKDDVVGVGYIKNCIMKNYPQLHVALTDEEKEKVKADYKKRTGQTLKSVPQTDGGVGWYLANEALPCGVTGFKTIIRKKGHPFSLSPNGLVLQTTGYSQKTGHAPHETNGVRAFANIAQSRTNIPDLRAAFVLLYETIVADWKKTPEARAAEEEAAFKTLENPFPQVIRNISVHSLLADRRKGRECALTSPAEVVKRVKAVRMRCHTTGVLMAAKSGWNKIHGDRIRNALGHVDGNIEWKCALFMSRYRLTRKQFLHGFLEQELVELPNEMRAELQAEYAAIDEDIEDCMEVLDDDDDDKPEAAGPAPADEEPMSRATT